MNSSKLIFNDFYQLTMAYAYWKNNRHNVNAVFALYFRKNPFKKEFTIFAGLNRFLNHLDEFFISDEDIGFCKKLMGPTVDPEFFNYLKNINFEDVEIQAFDEGALVFPTEPLVQISGPIAVLQLLETVLLNYSNFASLVATNAAHFRIAAGKDIKLYEFGCRRAQGPDGALSSSLYSYIGGFDATSNVEAAVKFDIPVVGTIAHSFVSSFSSLKNYETQIKAFKQELLSNSKVMLQKLHELSIINMELASEKELISFVSFACTYPDKFVVIIDTYNVLKSGLPNFCAVALGLNLFNHKSVGIRIDSGDLAYFSIKCREIFKNIATAFEIPWFEKLLITVSNEINIDAIYSMNLQKHQVDAFGIGNNLVTCSSQPSLGMVFKLVQYDGQPTMKLTEQLEKVSIPFMKNCYRFFDKNGIAMLDFLTLFDEPEPLSNESVICFHPFEVGVKVMATPSKIERLNKMVFKKVKLCESSNAFTVKQNVEKNLSSCRCDHLRYVNPAPYKISLSEKLYQSFHAYKDSLPIAEIN